MKLGFFKGLLVFILALSRGHAFELDPDTIKHAKAFLATYVKAVNTRGGELPALYSETALITVTITTKDRRTYTYKMNGQDWKRLLQEKMTAGKPAAEPVELHNVRLQGNGKTLEIAAQRYDLNRCFWDTSYSLVIAKDDAGQYRINKETLFIDHNNQCQPPETLTIKQAIHINQNPMP